MVGRLIGVLLSLVIFCGCISTQTNNVPATLVQEQTKTTIVSSDLIAWNLQECDKVVDFEYDRDICYLGVATVTNDSTICDNITESNFKDECYWEVGVTLGNSLICEKILGELPKYDCLAITQKDEKWCERIGENSKSIPDQDEIDACKALVRRNPELCGSSSYADGCFFLMSRLLKDENLCDKLSYAPSTIGLCHQLFKFKLKPIENEQEKPLQTLPTVSLSKNIKDQLKECDSKQNDREKYYCYTTTASSNNETGVCSIIPDENFRESCYKELAQQLQDPRICDKIGEKESKYSCYTPAGYVGMMYRGMTLENYTPITSNQMSTTTTQEQTLDEENNNVKCAGTPIAGVTATGFSKFPPQKSSDVIYTSEGVFTAVFKNNAGTTITINNVTMTFKGEKCLLASNSTDVAGGSYMKLVGTCSPIAECEPFLAEVTIDYQVIIDGFTTLHEESGSLRGIVK